MTDLQLTLANLQSEYQRNAEINKALRVKIQDLKFQVSKEKAFAKVLRQSAKAQKLAAREAKKAARIAALEAKLVSLKTGAVGVKAVKMNRKPGKPVVKSLALLQAEAMTDEQYAMNSLYD